MAWFECFKWSVALLSIIGVILNIRRHRSCFYIWSFTNSSWVVVDLYHGVWSQAALCGVYVGLALWGIMAWRRTP
jgi:nicotinamide riboside transporter PnuC